MRVLVCVKEVLDSSVPLEILEAERRVRQREPDPIYLLGPADRAALELAVRMRERGGSGPVVVATVGPERAEASLALAIAAGADAALLVLDPTGGDLEPLGTALVLGRLANAVPFDLVLCGVRSLDLGSAAVPGMLAELLDLPQVTGVADLAVENGTVRAQQRLERGNRREVVCPLPAVVSVHASVAEPRYVSMWAMLAADRSRIERRTLAELDLSDEELVAASGGLQVVGIAAPRLRVKKLWTPDAAMSAKDRLKFLTGGGAQKKSSTGFLEGPPDQVAGHLLEYLAKEKLLPEDRQGERQGSP